VDLPAGAARRRRRRPGCRRCGGRWPPTPGPLADGSGYEWIEPYREEIRRQAADAALALADALTDPQAALRVLGAAIQLHPYTEELYVAAVRRHAAAGHLDGRARCTAG
jgi:DNA-binding SARP family transcriptional activator